MYFEEIQLCSYLKFGIFREENEKHAVNVDTFGDFVKQGEYFYFSTIWNTCMSMYDCNVPKGEGIKTVLVKKCCPGPPGLTHFWMQALSKNCLKPEGVPGVDPRESRW